MAMHIDVDLTEAQQARLRAIPAETWFTSFTFRNGASPVHPNPDLAVNNDLKMAMAEDWIRAVVPGKRVLDLFSANGAFGCLAALAGAAEVVGVEFAPERVECANFVASTLPEGVRRPEFRQGDVYKLSEAFTEPFDVVLCLGGLYHVADPAHVLRQLGPLTREALILQTSHVLPLPGNWARFVLRRHDRRAAGMTSMRGGYGTWWYTPGCLRELLEHGGFDVVEERQPPLLERRRFPWYLARCRPLVSA